MHQTRNMGAPSTLTPQVPDEVQSARLAGLRYAIPKGPGIRRRRAGDGFVYLGPDDKPVEDKATLERIKSLVLPPAWSSVWISPSENGHIQAVGWDARGRKQYRYHPKYRHMRDLVKFDRMRAFGKALPKIRRAVARDLTRQGHPKRKILAAVVKLLETTYIRIGNEEYAEENNSFGLTTLKNQHVQILGDTLKFRFKGKSHQQHEITVRDKRLARIIRKCKEIPGSSLFEYLDEEGRPQEIESGDVNEYLREISGGDFTAKDFRTWGGTCLAASFLLTQCVDKADKETKSVLVDVVKEVASRLGNKPATCKKYYIHPSVMECYSSGALKEFADKFRDNKRNDVYEHVVLSLLTPLKRAKSKRVEKAA
ncbi:MAG: DNA topoisomerase IB [Acidobacteriaceae bacterium]|nr:DNA topoisomerase IB [Acidobacteriaceae bacterium]